MLLICMINKFAYPTADYVYDEVRNQKSKIGLSAQTQSSITNEEVKEPETSAEYNTGIVGPPRNLFEALTKDDDILPNIQTYVS